MNTAPSALKTRKRPRAGRDAGSGQDTARGLFATGVPPTFVRLPTGELHPHPDAPPARVIESIGEEGGVWLPLIVKKRAAGGYTVLDGHARLHSARTYGLLEVPVLVADEHGQLPSEALTLMANVQRQSNPLAEARAARRLLAKGFTPSDIRRLTGLDKAVLKRRLNLLEVDTDLQDRVGTQLSLGVLEAVARLSPHYRAEVEAAILLKTADPEAKFTHDDLRALSVVRTDDLRSAIHALPVISGAARANLDSALDAGGAWGPLPLSLASATQATPEMLFPERLSLPALIRAFTQELERGGHSLPSAIALLQDHHSTAGLQAKLAAAPILVIPTPPVALEITLERPTPVTPPPVTPPTAPLEVQAQIGRASLGRRAPVEAQRAS